jgi:hypothetical protein
MGVPPKVNLDIRGAPITADAMLRGVKLAMDARAWDLFERWFHGKAPAEVVLADDTWAAYMRADQKLAAQIRRQLEVHADSLRDEAKSATVARKPFKLQFQAETGSAQGGYVTGYEVLHGTNRSAGGFQVEGFYTIRPGAGLYSVVYESLAYTFNDIVDANKRWSADVVFARTAANMAKSLRVGPPKDYTVRIRWMEQKAITIPVAALTPGAGPAWLKTFPNR